MICKIYGKTVTGTSKSPTKFKDEEIEWIWDEFEDVLFIEEENGRLVLAANWRDFEAGIDRETIWHWFDKQHSKGINWLLNGIK